MRLIFILLFFIIAACTPHQDDCQNPEAEIQPLTQSGLVNLDIAPPQINPQIRFFNSCAEIVNHTLLNKDLKQKYEALYAEQLQCGVNPVSSIEPVTLPNLEDANPTHNQPTNTQEASVDEADRVKVSKKYIFYARETAIEVLSRQTKEPVFSIPVPGHWRPYIYVFNETLAIIRSHHQPFIDDTIKNSQVVDSTQPTFVPSPERFDVLFYDVHEQIRKMGEKTIVGHYQNSRLSADGLLSVITSASLTPRHERSRNLKFAEQMLSELDCRQVARPGVSDFDNTLTSVNSFDLSKINPSQYRKQLHLFGNFQTIYQNQDLYLTKSYIDWFWWDQRNTLEPYTNLTAHLELKNKKWKIHSYFEFQGEILGPWSFKEKDDYLFIATTRNPEASGPWASHLQIFKKTDKGTLQKGGITGIAPGETLRSARFQGDYAYLVTFLTIDPLFIIDISNPEQPLVVSELKIPGFSSYLHSTDDNRLIGVGFQDWSLQLSLFDVQDPENPSTLQQHVVEGSSSSPAQHDHHSFFYNDEWQLLGLPIQTDFYQPEWAQSFRQTGAFFYDLSENTFTEVGKISHGDWIQSLCPRYGHNQWLSVPGSKDVSRVHRIDDELMTFSDFGVRVHNPKKPNQELKRILFDRAEDSCPMPYAVCTILEGG